MPAGALTVTDVIFGPRIPARALHPARATLDVSQRATDLVDIAATNVQSLLVRGASTMRESCV
jgi:hypothetical protein